MFQRFKRFAVVGLLVCAVAPAMGFSLLGPNNETWQVPSIGYNPLPWDGLATGPKNLAEEYRRNIPVLYYSFDAGFVDYFGSNGVYAVEQAMKIMNGLTNVSSYSQDLTEFPLSSLRENYTAAALQLSDLKSFVLHLLVEQMGLAEPERYIWTIHSRWHTGDIACPVGQNYLLVRRNFNIVPTPLNQIQASSYVNGALYSYYIYEDCGDPPEMPDAEAREFPVDPLDNQYSAVASGVAMSSTSADSYRTYEGKYFIGLTRDDVAGLRYLMRSNNFNWESPGPTAISMVTNATPTLVPTASLGILADAALYSDPATLAAQGIISRASNYWVTVWVTNITSYLTNYPFEPAGSTQRVAYATNRQQAIETRWSHEFQNIYSPVFRNGQWTYVPVTNINVYKKPVIYTLRETTVGLSGSPFSPSDFYTLRTNIEERQFSTNHVAGEYFVLPTNACEVVLLSSQLQFTNIYVDLLEASVVTNEISISNAVVVTNFTGYYYQELIDYSTNHVFAALPVECVQTNTVLAGGIERVRFERRDYDSLLGRFFNPFTNYYTLTVVTNNKASKMRVQRPVTAPDFIFFAQDMVGGPAEDSFSAITRNISFSTNGAAYYSGLAGPGTIDSPTAITVNKAGEVFYNYALNVYSWYLAETNASVIWRWASFDGTTNAPVVYPNGATIQSLENMLFMNMSPATLPDGFEGFAYYAGPFHADGGVPPFTWSIPTGSGGLPVGLELRADGTIRGTPTERGTYDFVIRGTDSTGRYVERNYTVRINW